LTGARRVGHDGYGRAVLALNLAGVSRVVTLSAHSDDVEIAAGGLLLALAQAQPTVRVHYVVCAGSAARHAEARSAIRAFLPEAQLSIDTHELPDGRLPAHWDKVKEILESARSTLDAELVLAPWRGDAHQDHRLLAELAPTAFRDALVLHYEVPKWDGDLGRPNLYLPLTATQAHHKVELLHAHFPSQKHHDWWDDEVFLGLARIRGMECRAPYAEAFHLAKATMTVTEG
jgi:LmbE family N-acetylglucosaminyl deacetylase